ncbi:MAG: hypothetical protein M1836_008053 [Candelina mexicana]|nr:MAG: hypothetical protein M1836_008053 [Candelina mexicana]
MFTMIGLLPFIVAQLAFGVLCNSTPLAGTEELTLRATTTFKHPGVLLDKEQLDFIKSKVNSKTQPWTDAYNAMLSNDLGSLTRNPSPTSTVDCGPTSMPDKGCHQERQDALAAYAMSLAWYISGSTQYAQKAIAYMNAWAKTLKAHTNSNAPLQTGWAGAVWARAAEIVRYSGAGWAASDVTAFENLLRDVYLPEVIVGSNSNGNWELVMMEAAIGITIFLNDGSSYDKAMAKFLGRVPAYIYLTSDGSYPKAAPGSGLTTRDEIVKYWHNQATFPENGIAQETCRDFVHTGYGISSISHVAETSRIHGNDLYTGDVGTRLRYALGLHSKYELGAAKPDWLCPKPLKLGLGPITEIGYNALSTRLGNAMMNTETLTKKNRPAGTDYLFVGWETLTHANNTA